MQSQSTRKYHVIKRVDNSNVESTN